MNKTIDRNNQILCNLENLLKEKQAKVIQDLGKCSNTFFQEKIESLKGIFNFYKERIKFFQKNKTKQNKAEISKYLETLIEEAKDIFKEIKIFKDFIKDFRDQRREIRKIKMKIKTNLNLEKLYIKLEEPIEILINDVDDLLEEKDRLRIHKEEEDKKPSKNLSKKELKKEEKKQEINNK